METRHCCYTEDDKEKETRHITVHHTTCPTVNNIPDGDLIYHGNYIPLLQTETVTATELECHFDPLRGVYSIATLDQEFIPTPVDTGRDPDDWETVKLECPDIYIKFPYVDGDTVDTEICYDSGFVCHFTDHEVQSSPPRKDITWYPNWNGGYPIGDTERLECLGSSLVYHRETDTPWYSFRANFAVKKYNTRNNDRDECKSGVWAV